MDKLIVTGGSKLSGSINISGSKNASLPILAATILAEEACIIRRVPDVSDTNYMIQILNKLGVHVERSSGTVRTNPENIISEAPYDLVRKMRASICIMGPLLARTGKANVSLPGGCVIGDRPIDLHIKGLEALGAIVEMKGGDITLTAPEGGLVGAKINMRGKSGPTVLGTDNVMMAATLAKGTTIIESAACEPEVVDLANFLNSLGAKISGAGTRTITIEGVESLKGIEHYVIPDRIEAGTFMVAGAMASTGITLNRVNREQLIAVTDKLLEAGHKVEFNEAGDSVYVEPGENPKGFQIVTEPYPGFPTDMQAQFSALATITDGLSVIEDTIFPQRFMHCAEIKRMGADINVDNGRSVITGGASLSGAPVMASDLRASAALVLVGLCAEGETHISRLYHIDRGYENIDEKLVQLGANIQRVKE